jgi:hypothetical protein
MRFVLWALLTFGVFQIVGAVLHQPWFYGLGFGLTFVIFLPLGLILFNGSISWRGRPEVLPSDPGDSDRLA